MTLSSARTVSGLSALATATGSAVNWKESLGTKSRATNLPLAVTGYECSGTLGVPGNTFTLALANGTGAVTGASVTASLTTNLAGANNDLTFEAVEAGYAGNSISVAYSTAVAPVAATTVTVSGKAITVTRAAKARMVVTGTLSPDVAGTYLYMGDTEGKPLYRVDGDPDGYLIGWDGSAWYLGNTGMFYSTQNVATPDLVTAWVAVGGAAGVPTVTAGATTARQVMDAIAASVAASALVEAHTPGENYTYGEVPAMAKTNLANGVSGSSLQGADGKNIEGDTLTPLAAIAGIEIVCASGGLEIGCEGALQALPLGAGGVFSQAVPAGFANLLAHDLVLTATALNTAFSVTVLGSVA